VTLAVAHRGDPVAHRENTLPAFEAAVAAGADMVELDVWPSADGVAAVLHDETLDRLWNVPRRVGELTLAELSELGIPSLAEALDAIPVQVMVDYKHASAVDPALEAILAADALDRCVFAGENFAGHRRICALHEDARIALTWNWPDRDPEPLLDELGAEFFNPDARVLRENLAFLDRMRERGTAVSVWTLDERRHLEWALGLGVDAVITNRIHDLLELRTAC
jgi:glycerophosphoryl diester phosphodiesterase